MESNTVVSIILILVILAVLMVLIVPSSVEAIDADDSEIGFRQACLHWSMKNYEPITADNPMTVTTGSGVETLDMEGLCKTQLGTLGEVDWEKCKVACQLYKEEPEEVV